ncbi:MAG: hypothetical protein R6W91_01300 [Thermoplasmata archaeon]
MCGDKKNNRLEMVLDIRTSVLRLVVDTVSGRVLVTAPLNRQDEPSVEYTVRGRFCT